MAKTPAATKPNETEIAAMIEQAKTAAAKLIAEAKDEADKIKADARAEASKALEEATRSANDREAEAKTIISDARIEASRIISRAQEAAGKVAVKSTDTQAATPVDMKGGVRIRSKVDGFRRGGVAHPKDATEYPAGAFTDKQIATFKAEPNLVVEDL